MTQPVPQGLVAAPGTIVGLHGAIKSRLAQILTYRDGFLTKSGAMREPAILDGFVPPKSPTVEQFPFVIVRPSKGVDSIQEAQQSAEAQFEIIIGVYRDEDDGFLDALVLVDAIRLSFNADPTLDGTAYEQIGPMTWALPVGDPNASQARPQWLATMNLNFQIPRPVREWGDPPRSDR